MQTIFSTTRLRRTVPIAGLALSILLLPQIAPAQGPCVWFSSSYYRYDASQSLSRHVTLARIVADTADLAARENAGIYRPLAPVQTYLPGNRLLVNPTTGHATEPSGSHAASAGEVGYRELVVDAGYPDVAIITILTTSVNEGSGGYGLWTWWRSASPDDRERASSLLKR